MNNRFKKFLAALLTAVMLLSMLPTSVFADDTVEQISTVEATSEPTEAIVVDATTEPADKTTTETTVELTVKSTTEATMEPTVEPASEATAKPAAESVPESTVESTVEPVSEETVEPTAESVPESTVESTGEPVSEETVEPAAESASDAIVEPPQETEMNSDPANVIIQTNSEENDDSGILLSASDDVSASMALVASEVTDTITFTTHTDRAVINTDYIAVGWESGNANTSAYIVNVKLLDGEPDPGNEDEDGLSLIEEEHYQTAHTVTFPLPATSNGKYVKVNVMGVDSTGEQTEKSKAIYLLSSITLLHPYIANDADCQNVDYCGHLNFNELNAYDGDEIYFCPETYICVGNWTDNIVAVAATVLNLDTNESVYWAHIQNLSVTEYPLSNFGSLIVGEKIGNSDMVLEVGGEYVVEVYATTENGLGFDSPYITYLFIEQGSEDEGEIYDDFIWFEENYVGSPGEDITVSWIHEMGTSIDSGYYEIVVTNGSTGEVMISTQTTDTHYTITCPNTDTECSLNIVVTPYPSNGLVIMEGYTSISVQATMDAPTENAAGLPVINFDVTTPVWDDSGEYLHPWAEITEYNGHEIIKVGFMIKEDSVWKGHVAYDVADSSWFEGIWETEGSKDIHVSEEPTLCAYAITADGTYVYSTIWTYGEEDDVVPVITFTLPETVELGQSFNIAGSIVGNDYEIDGVEIWVGTQSYIEAGLQKNHFSAEDLFVSSYDLSNVPSIVTGADGIIAEAGTYYVTAIMWTPDDMVIYEEKTIVVTKPCDHPLDMLRYDVIESKAVYEYYDGVNHRVINTYNVFCTQCGVYLKADNGVDLREVVDDTINAALQPHEYDESAKCIYCGAQNPAVLPTPDVQANVSAYVNIPVTLNWGASEGAQSFNVYIYKDSQQIALLESVKNLFADYTFTSVGEFTADVYATAVSEEDGSWKQSNPGRMTITVTCKEHVNDEGEYVKSVGKPVDNGNGTHTHVYITRYTCQVCHEAYEVEITDDAEPHNVKNGKASYDHDDDGHWLVTPRECSCGYAEKPVKDNESSHYAHTTTKEYKYDPIDNRDSHTVYKITYGECICGKDLGQINKTRVGESLCVDKNKNSVCDHCRGKINSFAFGSPNYTKTKGASISYNGKEYPISFPTHDSKTNSNYDLTSGGWVTIEDKGYKISDNFDWANFFGNVELDEQVKPGEGGASIPQPGLAGTSGSSIDSASINNAGTAINGTASGISLAYQIIDNYDVQKLRIVLQEKGDDPSQRRALILLGHDEVYRKGTIDGVVVFSDRCQNNTAFIGVDMPDDVDITDGAAIADWIIRKSGITLPTGEVSSDNSKYQYDWVINPSSDWYRNSESFDKYLSFDEDGNAYIMERIMEDDVYQLRGYYIDNPLEETYLRTFAPFEASEDLKYTMLQPVEVDASEFLSVIEEESDFEIHFN